MIYNLIMDNMDRKFDTFIFDLDGTLLDTVPDLIALTNRILNEFGFPERSREDVISFVGGGLRRFLELALPSYATDSDVDRAIALWEEWFIDYYEHTDPYEGIPELLEALRARGCKTAIFSNRDQEGVDLLIERSPIGGFDLMLGTSDEIPRKPDPAGVIAAIEVLGAPPERAIYIGDTPGDIVAGNEAGCTTAAVLGGYHSKEELEQNGPDIVVTDPPQLLEYAD